jgi:hypothetical protein
LVAKDERQGKGERKREGRIEYHRQQTNARQIGRRIETEKIGQKLGKEEPIEKGKRR